MTINRIAFEIFTAGILEDKALSSTRSYNIFLADSIVLGFFFFMAACFDIWIQRICQCKTELSINCLNDCMRTTKCL